MHRGEEALNYVEVWDTVKLTESTPPGTAKMAVRSRAMHLVLLCVVGLLSVAKHVTRGP